MLKNNLLFSKIKTSLLNFEWYDQRFQSFLLIFFYSAAITFYIRKLYYRIFPWVLSKNVIFPIGKITPWIQNWQAQRDGIEIYVLYTFIFLIMALLLIFVGIIKAINNKWINVLIVVGGFLAFSALCKLIIFTPPTEIISSIGVRITYSLIFTLIIILFLVALTKVTKKIENSLVYVVLIPFCFIATSPIDIKNYAYIFSPAQKLLEGVSIRQIYFQYDIFLSIIAAFWMKLGLNISKFQVLGQFSNYLAMINIFLLSCKLFRKRSLAMLLLISLVLVRIASAPWDPVCVFQITPLRLDLWMIPFLIIFLRGYSYWLVPFSCGVLMLIHGAFGQIYTLAFIQLMITLGVLMVLDQGLIQTLKYWLEKSALRKIAYTTMFLFFCFALEKFLFKANLEATSWYQKIGIGFIPLAETSFFWFYPIIISSSFVMLCLLRNYVSRTYLSLGFILIYFTIGNCIYFFGRSHELNLFSIAISLVFLLFFCIDLTDRWLSLSSPTANTLMKIINDKVATVVALTFIGAVTYYCFDQISANLSMKYKNAKSLTFQMGDPFSEAQVQTDKILNEVNSVVGKKNSLKIMVADEGVEFLFYQRVHGNNAYFYPFSSWIFLDDLIQHAQEVIDNSSYILIDKKTAEGVFDSRLKNIGFKYTTKDGKYVLISQRPPVQ